MIFGGKHNAKQLKIINDLVKELNILTRGNNKSTISKLVNTLYDVDIEKIARAVLIIKDCNADKLERSQRKAISSMIFRCIKSKNSLNDADAHPIGQDLSIFSCSEKSQSILNVKRLAVKHEDQKVKSKKRSVMESYIENLKYENNPIIPNIKDSTLYTYHITWFRIVLTTGHALQELLESSPKDLNEHLSDIHILSNQFNIVELYYRKKAKINNILQTLENSNHVVDIVFCSDLVKVKNMAIPEEVIFSNMLKFYYCYKTKNNKFDLTSQNDLQIFHYVYIMCSIFMKAPKFGCASAEISPAPISMLSYNNPIPNIIIKSRMVEDLSDYDRTYIRENPQGICNTTATEETLTQETRHVIVAATQDRDLRVMKNYCHMGGVNQLEVVLQESKDQRDHRINILKTL